MTPERFTVMAVSGKSETLEFEGTKETRCDAATTVCAMLNQRCAHVLLDATAEGDVVGQPGTGRRSVPPLLPQLPRQNSPHTSGMYKGVEELGGPTARAPSQGIMCLGP